MVIRDMNRKVWPFLWFRNQIASRSVQAETSDIIDELRQRISRGPVTKRQLGRRVVPETRRGTESHESISIRAHTGGVSS
jgi:hypothetical protein